MAVQIPVKLSPKNKAIVVSVDNTFQWENRGTATTDYKLIIRKNSDNSIIYDSGTITSSATTHLLSANTLLVYVGLDLSWTVEVNVGNSFISNAVFFKTYSLPIISITDPTFPSPVLSSQDYTFIGSYSQVESLELESYKFILYDELGTTELLDSGIIYGANPEYEFSGMDRGGSFQVEYIAYPADSLGTFTTGKQLFSIDDYVIPDTTPEIEVTADNTSGTTTISWADLIVINGTSVGTTSYTTGKFNQGIQADDDSSYIEFEYDIDGDDFTLTCYNKRPFTRDGSFIVGYDELTASNIEVGFDQMTSRFYVTKDTITTYGNQVTPYTLNAFSAETLNQFSSNTLGNLETTDYDDNFLFIALTKDRLYVKLDTPDQTFIDTFIYSRTDSKTFSKFRFVGKNIFDQIHIYRSEFDLVKLEAIDIELIKEFGVDTYWLAKLDGDLNAGNVISSIPITGWRVKRKEVGSTITTTLSDLSKTALEYIDTTGANGVQYEYSVFTLTTNGESLGQTGEGELNFRGIVITDGTESYLLKIGFNGASTGTTSHNKPSSIYSNNYSEKPSIAFSSNDYRTGSVTGVLHECIDNEYIITRRSYMDSFRWFINNGLSKIYKDTMGNVIDVVTTGLTDTVNQNLIKIYNEDKIQPVEVSFGWVEVEGD